jgi:uncharacterized protein YbaR (Trm112 family)
LLSDDLLDILACPVCKTSVHVEGEELVCAECERRFPIVDGMPVMRLEEEELEALEAGTLGTTLEDETARSPANGSPSKRSPTETAPEHRPPEGDSPSHDRVES